MKTVLIADDDPRLRRLMQATIASSEYRVVEAVDGNEAERLIRSERPAVVLLDVQMPGQSGLAVAQAVRRDPELAATKIIMLTAAVEPAQEAAGYEAGADLYLTKPFSPLQLLDALDEALGLAT